MSLPHINLIGPIGSGKTTLASFLVEQHGYKRIAFADALRMMLAKFLKENFHADDDFSIDDIIDRMMLPGTKQLYRPALQWIGTDYGRMIDPDFWVNRWHDIFDSISTGRPVVVDDCRFQNEFNRLRSLGFRTVRLAPNPERPDTETHASEVDQRDFPHDYYLYWTERTQREQTLADYLERTSHAS